MIPVADRVHADLWRALRALPGGHRLYDDPALRGAVVAAMVITLALGLTLAGPLVLLVAAPLLLGVPHIAADLRYLVLRPPRPLPRALQAALATPLAALIALRLVAVLGGLSHPRLELGLGAASVIAAAVWARGPAGVGVAALAAALTGPALLWPREAALLFGHAHNFVALGFWFAWVGGRGRWVVVAGIAVTLGGIASGAADPWAVAAVPAAGHTLAGFVGTLAPDLPGPWGTRAVLAFAFMQAVHYGLWLVCVPGTRTFRDGPNPATPTQRWRSWRADLGLVGVGLIALGVGVMAVGGLWDPARTRSVYLSLVLFHGWLELAIGAHMAARAPG